MKVKSEREVAYSCPTLCDPMDCSLPGSHVPGTLQARALEEWGPIAFSEKYINFTNHSFLHCFSFHSQMKLSLIRKTMVLKD